MFLREPQSPKNNRKKKKPTVITVMEQDRDPRFNAVDFRKTKLKENVPSISSFHLIIDKITSEICAIPIRHNQEERALSLARVYDSYVRDLAKCISVSEQEITAAEAAVPNSSEQEITAAPNPAPNDADGDSTGTLIAAMTATAALIGIGAVLVNSLGRKDAAPTNDRPLKSHL